MKELSINLEILSRYFKLDLKAALYNMCIKCKEEAKKR